MWTSQSLTFVKIATLNHFIIAIEFEMKASFSIFNWNDKMIERCDFDESYRSNSPYYAQDCYMLRIVVRAISMEKTAFENRHFWLFSHQIKFHFLFHLSALPYKWSATIFYAKNQDNKYWKVWRCCEFFHLSKAILGHFA